MLQKGNTVHGPNTGTSRTLPGREMFMTQLGLKRRTCGLGKIS